MKKNLSCLFSFIALLLHTQTYPAVVLKGDSNAPADQSFSFAINAHVQNNLASNFYVAADSSVAPGQAGEFAICATQRGSDRFAAFAPEIVNLNGVPNSQNPLFDKGIAFLALLQGELVTSGGFGSRGEHAIAVSADDRKTVYLLVDFIRETIKNEESTDSSSSSSDTSEASESTQSGFRLHMRSATNGITNIRNIPDADGNPTSGIVGLLGSQSHALACCKPFAGNFGDLGTGVAEIVLGAVTQHAVFTVVDAHSGLPMLVNKAAALDRSSEFIKIGNNIFSMDDVVDMHWDGSIGRAFIALRVQANGGANDGARAIVVARFENSDEAPAQQEPEVEESSSSESSESEPKQEPQKARNKLILGAIAPASAFDATPDKIVGVVGPNALVSINKVRSMQTSTGTFYLIVLGGNGAPQNVAQEIYALPLVNGASDVSLNGTIADKNSVPENYFGPNSANTFFNGARTRTQPATQPDQMPTSADRAVQVGGGAVPFGEVTDLFVSRDAVFVTVLEGAGFQQPGTFYSQALFNETGNIVAWTSWQRVGGHINQTLGGAVDPITADAYSLIQLNGAVNTVTKTDWSSGASDGLALLTHAFEQVLPQDSGGIRALFDVPVATPGLLDISLLIGVGHRAIVLGQTGTVQLGALIPVSGDQFKNVQNFENGTITTTLPIGLDDPTIVSISGGLLSEITPITAAEIAANDAQGWIVCGGCRGMAVLSDDLGAGWDLATGLGANFTGLTVGMNFKRVGEYAFVRKLMCDNGFLYVLTDSVLDRIDLNADNFGLGEINPVRLATRERVPGGLNNGTFLDCIISGKFALIATSAGLIRVGNQANIATAVDEAAVNWTSVPVPESGGQVYKLIPISVGGRAQDLAIGAGGNLYALGAYRGKDRSQLNRFVVRGLGENDPVDENTILPLPDLFMKDKPSYLVNFGDLRTCFATDGSVFFHSRSRQNRVSARVDVLPIIQSPPQSGIRFQGPRSGAINAGIPGNSFIGAIVRDSTSGSWLISGDFGLRVNE